MTERYPKLSRLRRDLAALQERHDAECRQRDERLLLLANYSGHDPILCGLRDRLHKLISAWRAECPR